MTAMERSNLIESEHDTTATDQRLLLQNMLELLDTMTRYYESGNLILRNKEDSDG